MLIKLSNNALNLCNEILGQLSDGYWENSSHMEGYWRFAKITNDGLEVSDKSYDIFSGKRFVNLFYDKSEMEIKKWFADKVKFILKKEADYGYKNLDWKLENFTNSAFLHTTVDNVVKAYNELRNN